MKFLVCPSEGEDARGKRLLYATKVTYDVLFDAQHRDGVDTYSADDRWHRGDACRC